LVRPSVNTYDCDRQLKNGWHCSRSELELGNTGWVAYRIHRPK
jgi:hypothetical protein